VRLGKAHANLAAWAQSVDAADLFVSAITIMALEFGVLWVERNGVDAG
jgi:toxin FitB